MAKKVKETRMESGVGRGGGGFNAAKGRREESVKKIFSPQHLSVSHPS